MLYAQLHLTLPAWVHEEVDAQRRYPDADSRIALAIQLSRRNVDHRSGGPFGAAVFNEEGRLIGVGVNRVVPHNCSAAHAEVMALTTSQQRMQSFRLNQGGGRITLATSAQPCSMCYGALIWAGIDELLIAARADDVQTLAGFDEGPLPADWQGELEKRGIAVHTDLMRDHARDVLRDYGESGLVY
ncbi:MAG TPA: nucleoside deaminase [Arenimonas sp.]|uniref:nucleoside deaminase n=1 Tax=Arenimonas sp. TaxID=1872635 RepID=UPI002D7EA18D|nr:nucleoside deaminase [Arenimonas sp.]HEU0153867.1 nucleoside deaminase [Arenimonas sp.]